MLVCELDMRKYKSDISKDIEHALMLGEGKGTDYIRAMMDLIHVATEAVNHRIPDVLRIPEVTVTQLMPDPCERKGGE